MTDIPLVTYSVELLEATINKQVERIEQLEAALREGWQLVPIEPTKEMIQAAIWALDRWREKHGNVQCHVPPGEKYQIRWRAMLAAAVSPGRPGVARCSNRTE